MMLKSRNMSFYKIVPFIILSFLFVKPIASTAIEDTSGCRQKLIDLRPYFYTKPDSVLPILDSLMRNLKGIDDGTLKEMLYRAYGNIYLGMQKAEKATQFYRHGISMAKHLKDFPFLVKFTSGLGIVYLNQGNYDSAAPYLNSAYRLAQRINDTPSMSQLMTDLAHLQSAYGRYDSAVTLLYLAEPYFLHTNNNFQLLLLYNKLGVIFQNTKNFKNAMHCYQMALHYDSLTNKLNFAPQLLSNIGQLYFSEGKYDTALYNFLKAKELLSASTDPRSYYGNMMNIANNYYQQKAFKKALAIYKKVSHAAIFNKDKTINTAVTINFGNVYFALKRYDSAHMWTKRGLQLAQKNSMKVFERNALETLFLIDSAQGNWVSSIEDLKSAHRLSDSLVNERTLNNIENIRLTNKLEKEKVKNDFLKKENKLRKESLQKQRIFIFVLAGFILFFIILLSLLIKNRHKIKKLNGELKEKNAVITRKNRELLEYSEQLEQQNRMKNKFFSIISHDLRSPFNSLLGIIEVLESPEYELSDEERKELISSLGTSARLAYNLVQNLLEWSRLQQGKIENTPFAFHVKSLSVQTCELYALNAAQKEITLACAMDEEIMAYADERLFANLLNNLVNNALKFTNKKGSVKITSSVKNDVVEVCVSDTGIGIPKDKLETLFDVDNEYLKPGTSKERGTGLGLTLCKEYAVLMGGTISVESTEGEGSRFCFTLPAKA